MDEVLQALMDSVGSSQGFDALDQMRQSSPSSSPLGQVTNREMQALGGEQSYEDWYNDSFGGGMPDELRNNYRVLYGDRWSADIERELEKRYAHSHQKLNGGYPGQRRNTSMDGEY